MTGKSGAIIKKITRRYLKANTKRNIFIMTAIALTAFMLTSVFSIGFSLNETFTATSFRLQGSVRHMALLSLDAEQMDALQTLEYVRHIGTNRTIGFATATDFAVHIPIVYANETNWRYFLAPAFTDVNGDFAQSENEIMLSRSTLFNMGIENPYIGMEIPLEFTLNSYEVFAQSFILAAYYTDFTGINMLLVSPSFAENNGQSSLENLVVNIIFNRDAAGYATRLLHDLNIRYGQDYIIANTAQDTGVSTVVMAVVIVIVFLMLTGFLLIYNVMYISVSKDVRFYGMLKTLGADPKQIRRLVNGQVLKMCMLSLPIGLLVAWLTSFLIVPAFVDNTGTGIVVSFSPAIFVGGSVFTLITAYLGAFTSAKKAAHVSPIEAVRYVSEPTATIKFKTLAKGKPHKMALRNIFREPRRAGIVLLSLFLGITVFVGIMGIVTSMDIESSVSAQFSHDIAISSFDINHGIDEGLIEQILAVNGVESIRRETLTAGLMADGSIIGIRGVDTSFIRESNEELYRQMDIEAFERMEIAFVDMVWGQIPGDSAIQIEAGEGIHTVEISGAIHLPVATHTQTSIGDPLRIIMAYSDERQGIVMHVSINVADGMVENASAAVAELIRGQGMVMASSYAARQAMEDAQGGMIMLGLGISAILALIGIFNFVNVVSVGLITRKRELATLESVGMTKSQTKAMLRWEGAIYCISTVLASITLGTGISFGLFSLVHNQDPILYPQFVYPIWPVLMVFGLIATVCSVTPDVVYTNIRKASLVDRLREAE